MILAVALAVLNGVVGPGFTIALHHGPLHAGRYKLVVADWSAIHNFHLRGPGVNVSTGVQWTGTKTFVVRLRRGRYTFVCDPHADLMRGSFRVR